ncbi:MAG: hypothetical protein ROM54_03060 [Anaerobiospirillum sp.]|nr:hypothetical protein [Anaerobiospirillum sp.]
MREHLSWGNYLCLLALLILSAALTLVLGRNEHFDFTQVQFLLHGLHAAFTGQYLPFGVEGGLWGNNPGVLSSWLVGFPFKLVSSSYAPLYLQVLLDVLALILMLRALTQLFAPRAVMLGALFLTLGPWALGTTGFNPAGFLSLGSALVLSSLVVLRRDRDLKISGLHRLVSTLFLFWGLTWCLQVHSSWPVLWLMVLLLWLRRDISLSLVGLILGLILAGLSLAPYLAQVASNPSLTNITNAEQLEGYWGYGIVHVYPLLLGLLDVLRLGSLWGSPEVLLPVFSGQEGLIATILGYGFIGLYWLVGLASLLVTASCAFFVLSRFSGGAASGRLHLVRAITLCALLSALLLAAAMPRVITTEDVVVLLPFALLPLLAYFSVRAPGYKPFLVVSLVFMVLSLPVMALSSQRFNGTEGFHQQVYRTCLMAFPEQDCFAYGAALPDDVRLNMAGSVSISEGLVARVLQGQIPEPNQLAQIRAQRAERAAAAAAAVESGAEVTTTSAAGSASLPAAAPLPADAPLAPQPTDTPLVSSTPLMESSGELKLESEAQQNEAPEGSVVDTGSGVTGELIIN